MSKAADAALFDAYKDADAHAVRDLARSYTNDAIATLVKLMKAPKTPAGVKRACASDILAQGWGRPDARGDSDQGKAGITINILKLSTGVVERITHNSPERDAVMEAVEVAETIALGDGSE